MTAPAPDPRQLVLGIETSCDDTACAVVDGEGRVLSSVVSSQLAHRPYGGVVPEIASREHLRSWPLVSAAALEAAGIELADVAAVAATRGPGLVGSLLVGLSLGKSIAYALGRPFYAVHHLEGHLYSPFLAPPVGPAAAAAIGAAGPPPASSVPDRFVGAVLSGGHSNLYRVDRGAVTTLAETRDDAMGEVFDKLGKRLGLPYPQGPAVARLAEIADPAPAPAGDPARRFRFAVAACSDHSLDFSYSGLKSQALAAVAELEREGIAVDLGSVDLGAVAAPGVAGAPPAEVLDLLAAFRAAAVGQVIDRLERLWRAEAFSLLALSGGVAANRRLRREAATWCAERGVELAAVPLAYAGDNAAMIAHAALIRRRRGEEDDPFAAEAASRVRIETRGPQPSPTESVQ